MGKKHKKIINDIEKKILRIEQQQNDLLQKLETLHNNSELKVLEELNILTQLTKSLNDDQKQLSSQLHQVKEEIYDIDPRPIHFKNHSDPDYHVASLILDRL